MPDPEKFSTTREIPVIFLTAEGREKEILKGFEIGAVDYVTKPFSSVELLARVKSQVGLQKTHAELKKTNEDLRQALAEVKHLSGLLPICASCKKIRDDTGYWQAIENYITTHSDAQFSHGICDECLKAQYPEIADRVLQQTKNSQEKTE